MKREMMTGNIRGRTLMVVYGTRRGEWFAVDPGTKSWTRAAEFVTRHFPDFRLHRDQSLAGGHWSDSNGVTIELW